MLFIFCDALSELLVAMRRFIRQVMCSVVECYPEAVVDRVDYRKLFVAIAFGFFLWLSAGESLSVPESHVLREWTYRLCTDCFSSSDCVSKRVSYFSCNDFAENEC